MKSSFVIASNDLARFFRERGNLFGLVLLPVVITLVLGFAFSSGEGEERLVIDVIDEDLTPASASLLASLRRANPNLLLCPMDNDEEDACDLEDEVLDLARAQGRIEETDTLAVIVIPRGYQDVLAEGEPFEVSYYADPDFSAPVFIEQALQTALQEVNGALHAAEFSSFIAGTVPGFPEDSTLRDDLRASVRARAAALWAENLVRVEYQSTAQELDQAGSAPAGFYQSVPGIASMFVMSTVFGGMVALIGERKRWTLQRLVMMPIPGAAILGGKLSGRFTLGIIQFLVVFAVGAVVGMSFGDSLLGLFMILVSFTLAMTAISFALGTLLSTEPQAEALTQLLVLTLAPLGGAWWPLEITPRALQIIGHLSPVAWAMDGFHDLFLRGGDASSVLLETAVLLGFALVFAVLGARRFRYA